MEGEGDLVVASAVCATLFALLGALSLVILFRVNWRPWRIYRSAIATLLVFVFNNAILIPTSITLMGLLFKYSILFVFWLFLSFITQSTRLLLHFCLVTIRCCLSDVRTWNPVLLRLVQNDFLLYKFLFY